MKHNLKKHNETIARKFQEAKDAVKKNRVYGKKGKTHKKLWFQKGFKVR